MIITRYLLYYSCKLYCLAYFCFEFALLQRKPDVVSRVFGFHDVGFYWSKKLPQLLGIAGGQLYVTTASGALRLAAVGTGTPTTSGQTITHLNGLPTGTISPSGFVFLDRNAGVAGVDTVYFADDAGGGGIRKYSFDGAIWTDRGVVTPIARGLTGSVVAGNAVR